MLCWHVDTVEAGRCLRRFFLHDQAETLLRHDHALECDVIIRMMHC